VHLLYICYNLYKIEQFKEQGERTLIGASFICRNQNEKEVLKGAFSGIIKKVSD